MLSEYDVKSLLDLVHDLRNNAAQATNGNVYWQLEVSCCSSYAHRPPRGLSSQPEIMTGPANIASTQALILTVVLAPILHKNTA